MEEQAIQLFIKNIQKILAETYQSRGYNDVAKNGFGTKRVPNVGPGTLSSTIDYQIDYDENGLVESVSIIMEDYWEVVDLGRRAPRKFPPLNAIKDWIIRKPINFAPINGQMPTLKQQVFLIGRSIANKGIKGINFYERALSMSLTEMVDIMGDAEAAKLEELFYEKLQITTSDQIELQQ